MIRSTDALMPNRPRNYATESERRAEELAVLSEFTALKVVKWKLNVLCFFRPQENVVQSFAGQSRQFSRLWILEIGKCPSYPKLQFFKFFLKLIRTSNEIGAGTTTISASKLFRSHLGGGCLRWHATLCENQTCQLGACTVQRRERFQV